MLSSSTFCPWSAWFLVGQNLGRGPKAQFQLLFKSFSVDVHINLWIEPVSCSSVNRSPSWTYYVEINKSSVKTVTVDMSIYGYTLKVFFILLTSYLHTKVPLLHFSLWNKCQSLHLCTIRRNVVLSVCGSCIEFWYRSHGFSDWGCISNLYQI